MTVVSPGMRTIVFEGLDGAGKTTLFKAFEELTEHYYACFDRWPPISCYVYDKFLHRYQTRYARTFWFSTMTFTMLKEFDLRIVYVDTPPDICHFRRQDEESYTLEDYELQRTYYVEAVGYYERMGIPVLSLSGSQGHPKILAHIVNNWLEESKGD